MNLFTSSDRDTVNALTVYAQFINKIAEENEREGKGEFVLTLND